jgi:nucleotide-binding universal stress UspA family protein
MFRPQFKKILVPTDFSECSQAAVEYAVSLAKAFKGELSIFHVMEPMVYELDFSFVQPAGFPDLKDRLSESLNKKLAPIQAEGISAEGFIFSGEPSVEIIKFANSRQADLIVMGTRGRTGLAHVLLGSAAERVIQQAPCPVLAINASKKIMAEKVKTEKMEEDFQLAQEILGGKVQTTFCHLCGKPSNELICEPCKIRVQAEALEKKKKVEKEGKV